MLKLTCVALLALLPVVYSFYSINYIAGDESSKIKNDNQIFIQSPSALHVADIYTRLSGLTPLLYEDSVSLPTRDILANKDSKQPILLEVYGGKLPVSSMIQPVISSSAFDSIDVSRPQVADVVKILSEKSGITVENKVLKLSDDDNVMQLLKETREQYDNRPIIILHHETPSSAHYIHRNLLSSNTTVTALNEFQISQYQICLWSGVMFVLVALSAIGAVYNMEVIPDSLLFAKFISARTHKND